MTKPGMIGTVILSEAKISFPFDPELRTSEIRFAQNDTEVERDRTNKRLETRPETPISALEVRSCKRQQEVTYDVARASCP